MKQIQENILKTLKLLILLFIVSVGITYVSAWSGPPGAPFTCPAGHAGCDGPLHIGGTNQTKTGGLTVGANGSAFNAGGSANVTGALWAAGLYTNGGGYFGGNVGLGIGTPDSPLTFAGALGQKIHLYGIQPKGYSIGVEASNLLFAGGTGPNDAITFRTQGYDGTERVRIDGAGNVGIGTLSPAAKLDVRGSTETSELTVRTKTETASLMVTNGAADGHVLTSDAAGNATWKPPVTGGGAPTFQSYSYEVGSESSYPIGKHTQCFLQSFQARKSDDRAWCTLGKTGSDWTVTVREAVCTATCMTW